MAPAFVAPASVVPSAVFVPSAVGRIFIRPYGWDQRRRERWERVSGDGKGRTLVGAPSMKPEARERAPLLFHVVEHVVPPEDGDLVKLVLDPQKLVVFSHAVGAAERTGLDLARVDGDGEVG